MTAGRKTKIWEKNNIKYRCLAFFLCLLLGLEAPVMEVFASEPADVSEETGITEEDGKADEIGENEKTETEENEGTEAEENGKEGESEEEEKPEFPQEEEQELSEEEEGEADFTEGEEEEPESGILDGETDDGEGGLSSPNKGNISDKDFQSLCKEAEAAFAELTEEKDMMALLYHTDSYDVRSQTEEDSECVASLEIGTTLYLRSVSITENAIWYQVQFWLGGMEKTGYIENGYLAFSDEDWLAWEKNYLSKLFEAGADYNHASYSLQDEAAVYAADTSDIEKFPYVYRSALYQLKAAHPKWIFVPMNTGLDFDTVVQNEMGEKSLIQATTSNKEKGWVGNACPTESGWYYATKSAVSYHMNPCNFLTEDAIFQFEQLTYNSSYHSAAAVQSLLDGTFMKGVLPDDSAKRTYAVAFYEIGKNRKLSPIHLASRVYQEQGAGTSGLISGKYPGYEGYYNFFNVNVSGSSTEEKIIKGLKYAKEKGWNTRYKSLEGGAATIGNNYILKGQDTIYLEKFNVYKDSSYGLYGHQYMQNIQAPVSESKKTKSTYVNAGALNNPFVFKIPVFTNMPTGTGLTLSKATATINRGNTLQLTAYMNGAKMDSADSGLTWKSADTTIATVKNGLVTAINPGETLITAAYGKEKAVCNIKVKVPLEGISLNKTELTLRRPDTVVEDTSGLSPEEIETNLSSAVLQVSFAPEDTTDSKTIKWTSSDEKIATVKAGADKSTATVEVLKCGEVKITANAVNAGGKKASCKIKVIAPVYRLEVTNPNRKALQEGETDVLYVGQNLNLAAEYWPKNTTSDTKVVWSSNKPGVAEVDGGKVTGKAKGTAVITAQLGAYKADYTLEVEECRVTFMDRTGASAQKELTVDYGSMVDADAFPQMADTDTEIFIGWYTKPEGQGSVFNETTKVYEKQTNLYPYFEEQGRGFYVIPVGDRTYTGGTIKPAVQVYDGISYTDGETELIELKLNKDYTVSYKNNKKVNKEGDPVPTITVKGKGNYAGTAKVCFNILPKVLTDDDISAKNITRAYSGKVIKAAPAVYRGTKKLSADTDYKVTYPQTGSGAYKKAGTYPVVITGKGGYTGKITIYETITEEVLMSKVTVAAIANQPYRNDKVDKENGKGIEPEQLSVTYKRQVLTESTDGGLTGDYTVAYSNNLAVGTAKATITAVKGSGFTGSKTVTYRITGVSLAAAEVKGIVSKEYTGNTEDVKQKNLSVILNGEELEQGSSDGATGDYTVSYSGLSKIGTAAITISGINEYKGKIKKTYRIKAYSIGEREDGEESRITLAYCTQDAPAVEHKITSLSEISAAYVKGGTRPVVRVYNDGVLLKKNKDYTIKYSNTNAVTTPETAEEKLPGITIIGAGNYRGKLTGNFTITDGAMKEGGSKVVLSVKDKVYQPKKGSFKAAVTVKDVNGQKLQAGKDYDRQPVYLYEEDSPAMDESGLIVMKSAGEEVENTDIPQAGAKIRVRVQGIGAYAGDGSASVSAVYRITMADIANAKVKNIPIREYLNGKEVKLTPDEAKQLKVTMPGNAEPLIYGTDFILDETSYANNVNKGDASVIIKGLGENYGGRKKIVFKIKAKKLAWWKTLFR